jgi:CTP:molybdopterin cytidylyltransferase MocA
VGADLPSEPAGAAPLSTDHEPAVLGLLLAAGAGRRMGTPKALLHDDAGRSLVDRSVAALRVGGCARVQVVLGARAEDAAGRVTGDADVVVATDWDEGMGASLRAGLRAAQHSDAVAALVSLVDLADVGADVVRRVLAEAAASAGGLAADVLARASYDGAPGHPVLIGRDHWEGVVESARGDRGARDYLRAHPPLLVECGDLATGRDMDTPEEMRAGLRDR